MRAKIERFRSMRSAAEVRDIARNAVSALVERQERNTGSRMAAYEAVGSMIGASGSWVRRFVSDRATGLSFPVGLNIMAVFELWIDREIKVERTKIQALKRRIDAAAPKTLRVDAAEMGAPPPRKKSAAAVSREREEAT